MARAFVQVAATAEAAYAEVPAPQITAARSCTMEWALEEATRSSVVGQSSGCWRISLRVTTPRWLRLSEPESSLAVMNRHAFLRMKFTQKAATPPSAKARSRLPDPPRMLAA